MAGIALATAATALAGTPSHTRTVTVNTVITFPETGAGACSGQFTVAVKEVIQLTDFGNGVLMLTDHTSGTGTLVSDANGMTYTGRFSDVVRLESVPPGGAFAFGENLHFRATATDGSALQLNVVIHTTSTPSGTITVDFDKPVCRA
jgi:hypothetical protein